MVAVLVMVPAAWLGLKAGFIQDLFSEMPARTPSVRGMKLITTEFGPGFAAPLTVVLKSDSDLRESEGLALIDDVSRLLAHQRRLVEVRSATQPLRLLRQATSWSGSIRYSSQTSKALPASVANCAKVIFSSL